MSKIPLSFFQQDDVIALSKSLIGKYLFTRLEPENVVTGGMIIETEAYQGISDKACHAFNNRRTKRTETMFSAGGTAYIYFCYGIHHLFNIVTNKKDIPHAILIRAIKPEIGIDVMLKRRNKEKVVPALTSGPGSVCQALGMTREQNGLSVKGKSIWVEDRGIKIPEEHILTSPRIGVDYAGEDALKPWRFYLDPMFIKSL
ncbi:MAG TPA: DNA-3-methyladenine glycosylase [Parachlamydiaceae bacterium]|nr:DNA-3-methyladenine glycosylase [Parachlamydiaceae bacterium]